MSLKAFHIFFIAVAIISALGMAVWCGFQYFSEGSAGVIVGGTLSIVASIGLGIYLKKFLSKLRNVSIL